MKLSQQAATSTARQKKRSHVHVRSVLQQVKCNNSIIFLKLNLEDRVDKKVKYKLDRSSFHGSFFK